VPYPDRERAPKFYFGPGPPAFLIIAFPALAIGLFWFFRYEPATDRKLVFGCFEAAEAPPIAIGPSGLMFAGSDRTYVIPFELEYARGYQLSVDGSFALERQGERYVWEQTPRGWTYVLRFRGPETFSGPGAHDPNQLTEFDAVAEDRRFIRFVRTSRTACPSNEVAA